MFTNIGNSGGAFYPAVDTSLPDGWSKDIFSLKT